MSSITIPNSSTTVELNKSEIYELIDQLSGHLARDYGDYSFRLNTDNVIAVIRKHYSDNDAFLNLDEDTQRSTASGALIDTIEFYTFCDDDAEFEEIVEEMCSIAANTAIERANR